MRLLPRSIFFILCLLVTASIPTFTSAQEASSGDPFVGIWTAQESYFRPFILIERNQVGKLKAFLTGETLARNTPFSDVTTRGDSIWLELSRMDVAFQGIASADSVVIKGTWTQGEQSATLTLVPFRETASTEPLPTEPAPLRPQHPELPYPYVAEEVSFQNEADSITLAGTLTLPEGDGPHPAVVLLSGTGPQNRDAEAAGHQPFLVLADHLTRHGIAVLRYDKRGVGRSEGNIRTATFDNLAQDAAAALHFLKIRSDIQKAGLLGLSEGGYLAPLIHTQVEAASFLVLLAPPSVPGLELLKGQAERNLALPPDASQASIDSVRTLYHRVYDIVYSAPDTVAVKMRIQTLLEEDGVTGKRLQLLVNQASHPGVRDFARYDPQPILRQVDVPVLALYGGKDLQVTAEQNAGPMRAALAESPSSDVSVRVIDGLNHMLQPASTGHPYEYPQIEITMAPEVLNVLTDWIRARVSADE